METSFLPIGNSMLLFRAFFWCWKPLLKLGKPILKEKHFPASGNHFLWFSCQRKQFSRIVETYFTTNASFRIVGTYFTTNASFQIVGTDFLAGTDHFLYIFFRDRTYIFKDRTYSCWRKLILWPVENNLFHCFKESSISISKNGFFSPKE